MIPIGGPESAWMAGSSSMRLSASIPGLKDDPKWIPATTSLGSTSNEQSYIKDDLPQSSSFSKRMLEEEWYMTPDNNNALMDEMKELSYASQAENASSTHYNLDSPHLQSFLSRNVSSSSRPPLNRSNLSTYLNGGLPFADASGSTLMSNFRLNRPLGAHGMLDNQNRCANNSSSAGEGVLLLGTLNPSKLLSNLSPGSNSLGDGFNHSVSGDLSTVISGGINNSFANPGNNTTSPFGIGNGSYGRDGFSNSLSRTLMGGGNEDDKNTALLLNVERPLCPSKNNVLGSSQRPSRSSHHHQQPQQQTLFQKRAAWRHAAASAEAPASPTIKSPPHVVTSASNDSVDMPDEESPNIKRPTPFPPHTPPGSDEVGEFGIDTKQQKLEDKEEDDMDESGDGSGVVYETDDASGMEGGGGQQMLQGCEKGKGKKGMPAKNLLAERRRRKKLNDRLYMLRSVVPKITKMDRASILGDAIEYLKELLQRIKDLNTELATQPEEEDLPRSPQALLPPNSSLPCRVKEEAPSPLPSPVVQPARVEVRSRNGGAINIHMLCERRPGLMLSTIHALDGLGLDVQQAVISCFNGFALDVFKAEQSKATEVGPEEIRAVLLQAAGSSIS